MASPSSVLIRSTVVNDDVQIKCWAERMAGTPTLPKNREGSGTPKPQKPPEPRQALYCAVNVNGDIMPQSSTGAVNEKTQTEELWVAHLEVLCNGDRNGDPGDA
jgi:hypothetical protein